MVFKPLQKLHLKTKGFRWEQKPIVSPRHWTLRVCSGKVRYPPLFMMNLKKPDWKEGDWSHWFLTQNASRVVNKWLRNLPRGHCSRSAPWTTNQSLYSLFCRWLKKNIHIPRMSHRWKNAQADIYFKRISDNFAVNNKPSFWRLHYTLDYI